MNENEPKPATAAIGVIVEDVQAEPVAPDWGAPEPVIVQHLVAPAPTWRRANRGELAMWFGLGAASVVGAQIVAALGYVLMTMVVW